MYVLVEFGTKSTNIYSLKNVILKQDNKCVVKHKGSKYEANLLLMHESKEYLEKYADSSKASPIVDIQETEENNLSIDLSSFSIGSEYIKINSSSSLMRTSIKDIAVEMEEFGVTNSSSFSMLPTSIQEASTVINDEVHEASPYGSVKSRRWSTAESSTVFTRFSRNIECGKLPSFNDIQELKSKFPILKDRSSPQIKTWIHNQIRKRGGK